MTLLVARQCRLLGAPHGAVGALRRLQRPAVTIAARSYQYEPQAFRRSGSFHKKLDLTEYRNHQAELRKQLSESKYFLTPKYEESEIVPVNSAILIPASVAAVKPEHFVEKLEPIDLTLLSKQNLVVFLVTPSFAQWLLNDDVFLKKALSKLYKNLLGSLPKVHAICAVVDKLPAAVPVGREGGRCAVRAGLRSRAQNPPVNETGLEGIAYVLLPLRAEVSAQPKLAGEQGCIDFLAHTHTTNQGRHYDRLRVPLANTVFQTGEPSTMINSTWERPLSGAGLRLRSRRNPKTAVINLSAEDPKSEKFSFEHQSYLRQEAPALSIPLIPLTVPRQVDGYMGNIIRGIIGPDGNKMTASTELEQVVPQYFRSRDEPAQATSAWALVIPKDKVHTVNKDFSQLMLSETGADTKNLKPEDREYLEQKAHEILWQRDPPRWNGVVQAAIAKGARLHKVLSGGGGWGKKAGLLSLDPVPIGAPIREECSKMDTLDHFDSVDEFSTALKPVVEDGDFIQFFISTAVSQADETSPFENLKKLEDSTQGGVWSWEFGVVPSTVDSIPGGSWQHTGTSSEEIAVFRGSFGALTEGGLTLMRGRQVEPRTGLAEPLNATMIDVPFSRWSAVRLFPQPGVHTKTVGDFGKKAKADTGEGRVDISDLIHDASITPISCPYATSPTSSPFATYQRPQNRHMPPTTRGARTKSTFTKLKSMLVSMKPPQDELQLKSKTRFTATDPSPEIRSQMRKPEPLTPETVPASPTSEAQERLLVRKTASKGYDQSLAPRATSNSNFIERTQIERLPAPKQKQLELKDQTDQSATRRADAKLLPNLLQQERDERRRPEKTGKKGKVKRTIADEKASRKHEMLQRRKEENEEVQRKYHERRKTFREENPERRESQKQRSKKGFAIRKVGTSPSEGDTEARSPSLTADDVTERAKSSGKTLARLTEQLRLITGLKGSELETLRRWRRGKSLASPLTAPTAKESSIVRAVKTAKRKDIEDPSRTPQKKNAHNDSTVSLSPRPSHTAPDTPLHVRRVPHRNPDGLSFTFRSIPLSPSASPQPPHQPNPHNRKPRTLGQFHGALRTIIKQTHLLAAQLSTHLPSTPVLISRHAARVRPRSPLSRMPHGRRAAAAANRARLVAQRVHVRVLRGKRAGSQRSAARSFRLGARRTKTQRVRVRKHVSVGTGRVKRSMGRVRVRRVVPEERERRLEDEVGDWLSGGGRTGGLGG